MEKKSAIIIGAGPAGLTAAYELLDKTDIIPIIFEASGDIGGISRTIEHHGNRMDIGGHRFFSKSDRVMSWWQNILPLQGAPARDDRILGREVPVAKVASHRPIGSRETLTINAPDPEVTERVMLHRQRLSRILYLRKFFSYPISLSVETISKLGLPRIFRIGVSYFKSWLFPLRPEASLEDFFINRFGRELYLTFFKDYTEKVWGIACSAIQPEWGAQRIKGLSVLKTLQHAVSKTFRGRRDLSDKKVETTLIEQFIYPKLGPGQLWEETARLITEQGGELHLHHQVTGVLTADGAVCGVRVRNGLTGKEMDVTGSYVFSTMPVRELISAMGESVPQVVRSLAEGLVYRDFITVGVLLNQLEIRNETDIPTINEIIPDNWIYVQERDVKLGRIQVFNNWSPYLVADPEKVWLGLEYFCTEGDDLWNLSDEGMAALAAEELERIGIAEQQGILDTVVIRVPKAYPAYFGSYDRFAEIREYTDSFKNLFLIGRNGMHRYNNADHSMLTAMTAVENIINARVDHANIWAVNTEDEYHEGK